MKNGDFLEIEYVGKLSETGEIFDLTNEKLAKENNIYKPTTVYGPVTIVLGAGYILPSLDEKIKKLSVGDVKKLILQPEEAFGKRDLRLLKVFSMAWFQKQRMTPVIGQYVTLGDNMQGKVLSVSGGRVRMDFNHPLAGKMLEYDVKINKKLDDKKDQIEGIVTFYTGILKKMFKTNLKENKVRILMPKGVPLNDNIKKMLIENIKKYVKGIEDIEFGQVEEKGKKEKVKT